MFALVWAVGGNGTANPSLSQRNSQNFWSHQIIFTFVQILIPIAAPAFANKAPHCQQPTRDKSAARLWKFDTWGDLLLKSLLHPWWGTQCFFSPLFFPLWAAGNVHSVFGRSRAQLNAVSLLDSASYICFTIYFTASVHEGTAERTVHLNENCTLTASLCGKGFATGPAQVFQMACFKSKFQMCTQDGHL